MGASLLAMTSAQSTSLPTDRAPSRAGSLPQDSEVNSVSDEYLAIFWLETQVALQPHLSAKKPDQIPLPRPSIYQRIFSRP
ncbi:hypothetical protein FGE05_23150 [Pseudomonas sp. ICMP22404]|nr:hypothetical protein FGE05_23150 [Pseudomonas sp. ICMP22404]